MSDTVLSGLPAGHASASEAIKAASEVSEKTRYLRDPKNPNRVVTVVTRVVGNHVRWATAVNSPQETRSGRRPYRAGDRFTRKMGATIARGRLKMTAEPVVFDSTTQHPFVVALTHLSEQRTEKGETTSIARVARAELARMVKVLARRAEWKAHQAGLTGADRESI